MRTIGQIIVSLENIFQYEYKNIKFVKNNWNIIAHFSGQILFVKMCAPYNSERREQFLVRMPKL
jgi:hypothetical protein